MPCTISPAGGTYLRALTRYIHLNPIKTAACRELGRKERVPPDELRTKGPCAGPAKFVAVELACRQTGMTQRAIGAHSGKITSAAVSNIRRRIRQRQYDVHEAVEQLLGKLTYEPVSR